MMKTKHAHFCYTLWLMLLLLQTLFLLNECQAEYLIISFEGDVLLITIFLGERVRGAPPNNSQLFNKGTKLFRFLDSHVRLL